MANDIAVTMGLKNQQYMRSMEESRRSLKKWVDATYQSAKAADHQKQSVQRMNAMTGQQRMVLQNAIFMVEDAASVYGTMGLAGAVRAASNNLTMMAGAFGPWGMAATVAVTTATQLGLAFSKTEEETKKAADSLKEYKKQIEDALQKNTELIKLRQQLRQAESTDNVKGILQDRKDELETIRSNIELLKKQQAQAQQTAEAIGKRATEERLTNEARQAGQGFLNRKEVTDNAQRAYTEQAQKVQQFQDQINKLMEDQKRIESELPRIKERQAELAKREADQFFKQRTEQQKQVAEQQKQVEKVQEEQAARQKVVEEQRKQLELQRAATEEQRKRDKQQQERQKAVRKSVESTPKFVSGDKLGSRQFSESMARARREGFQGPDLSKREQQSVDTMQKNKDRLQQDDLRGGFDKRRQETIAEIDKQIQSVKDAARGRQQKTEDRDNKQAALDKATQENTKQQKMTVAALDRLAEEIQRRAADREQSGRMVQIGGLTL